MKLLLNLVMYSLCFNLVFSDSDTYRAGVITVTKEDMQRQEYVPLIHEAAKSSVDILVLPSPEVSTIETALETSLCSPDNYDKLVKSISSAAKQSSLYVVVHLYEKTKCKNGNEIIRSNVVFDRNGAIVSVYKKPFNLNANCNTTALDEGSFTTDFGVRFGVLMEEDLVLQNPKNLKDINNFVITGPWISDIPSLKGDQLSSSWAFLINANLVSTSGIYAGKTGLKNVPNTKVIIADLKKNGGLVAGQTINPPSVKVSDFHNFPAEDLSQYIIRPLDLLSNSQGHLETVCHGTFCCEFYLKTSSKGNKQSQMNYSLAVFEGVRHFGGSRHIGVQNCALLACTGLYKRTCHVESQNIVFDEINIRGNFTKLNSAQYPVILSTEEYSSNKQFSFNIRTTKDSQEVAVRITSSENLLYFGILSRDFSKDIESGFAFNNVNDSEGLTSDIYEYIYNEDVQEFFDYLWIRLRILFVVVSIYVLEMM